MARKLTPISRVATVLLAAAMLWALPVGTGGASAATQKEIQRARHTNVYVQGDSLTVGSASALRRTLGPNVADVTVDAAIGRFTGTGLARTSHDRRARNARVWVIALGTNDSPDPSTMRRSVRRSLRMAGSNRHVIWVTLQRPGPYGRVNKMLRRLAATTPRLHIVDWARLLNARSGLLAYDNVHATAAGYRARARIISQEALTVAQQP